jgi:hypothetical protein
MVFLLGFLCGGYKMCQPICKLRMARAVVLSISQFRLLAAADFGTVNCLRRLISARSMRWSVRKGQHRRTNCHGWPMVASLAGDSDRARHRQHGAALRRREAGQVG